MSVNESNARLPHFPPRGPGSFMSIGCIRLFGESAQDVELEFIGTDQETEVWRSDPIVVGSREDVFGVTIGPPDSTLVVAESDIRRQPQLPIPPELGAGARRKFVAELHSLHLKRDDVELFAGEPFLRHLLEEVGLSREQAAQIFRRSYGAVISQSLTGDPQYDFPADNYFDVFFGVKVPGNGDGPVTLYNRDPLVVVDLGIETVPPDGRVTIPQFPYDQMDLFDARDPGVLAEGGPMVARGGCCAHSVRDAKLEGVKPIEGASSEDKLRYASLDFDRLLQGTDHGAGGVEELPIWSEAVPAADSPAVFLPVADNPFVDGVFTPNGVTQISSSGLVLEFEDTRVAPTSRSVASGLVAGRAEGERAPIDLDPPTSFDFFKPPQRSGIGLGPNAGITFDLDAVREAHPHFYLVALVGIEGMTRASPEGASVRVRVLLDGIAVPFADNVFDQPGASAPIHVDLQSRPRFVTVMATSTGAGPAAGNGAIGLWELRGFGQV